MTDKPTPASTQRFNHVAMSLPADMLGEEGRNEITAFFGEVFGWEELPITVDRKQLVLQAHSFEQFLFLIAEDEPMACPRMDHFGMSVTTRDELDELHQRCAAYAERDDRVNLSPKGVEDQHGVLLLHNFYVRYLLPMAVEVQYFEWTDPDVAAMVAAQR